MVLFVLFCLLMTTCYGDVNTTTKYRSERPLTTEIKTDGYKTHTTSPPPQYQTTTTLPPTTTLCDSSSNICRRGYEGPQGSQGLPGVQGIQGPRGTQGIQGCRGAPGRIGPMGIPGTPGIDGAPGLQGFVGLKGDKGEPGTCTCEVEMAPPRQAASYVSPAKTFNAPESLSASRFSTVRPSAFSVARTTTIVPNRINDTTITFDVVHTNLGNDFNITSGTFTCPLNGTYHFTVHVYKQKTVKKPTVRLYKNQELIMVVDDFAPPNSHDSTSGTVILTLTKGDRLWLELRRKAKLVHNNWRRTTFSGFLLFPAEPNVKP